jgi:hypothetical protein
MTTIAFTPAQTAALLHRLYASDVIAEVFADTDGMEHLADTAAATANDLARQLINYRIVRVTTEVEREVMIEAVEGSTWVAVHDADDTPPQARGAARRALREAAAGIEHALQLKPGTIDVPTV